MQIPFQGTKPKLATPGAAGADLFTKEAVTLTPCEKKLVSLGVKVSIPAGYVGLLVARSSLHKQGLILSNSVGVIDSDFRGEIHAALENIGTNTAVVPAGSRLCQLVLVPAPAVEYVEVGELDATTRNDGGFGSTGR